MTAFPAPPAGVPRRALRRAAWEGYSAWSSAAARREQQAWRQAAAAGAPPVDVFGGVDDRRWLWLNTRGLRTVPVVAELLPSLPDTATQLQYTGSFGDLTLRDAWRFYRLVKAAQAAHAGSGPLRRSSDVLDFGCGWGRITRFFLKDVEPARLRGIDCDAGVLDVARRTNRWATFSEVPTLPPTALHDAGADLVYGFSVYSHLSEEASRRWLAEFARLLRPGGLLVVTTRPRWFIEQCAWLRTEAAAGAPASHRVSAGAFLDTAAALAAYDAGQFCFSHRGPDDPEHFGETCIPLAYVRRHWTEHFELVDFVDDPRRCPQAVVVLRR